MGFCEKNSVINTLKNLKKTAAATKDSAK